MSPLGTSTTGALPVLDWVFAWLSVKCYHNLSPFECVIGFQVLVFPTLEAQVHLCGCNKNERKEGCICHLCWLKLTHWWLSLLKHQSAQKVWLSSRVLLIQSTVLPNSQGASFFSYVGQYEIDLIINPTVVRLKLPPHMKIHPTFHASQMKIVLTSPLPLSAAALLPLHYQHSAYSAISSWV